MKNKWLAAIVVTALVALPVLSSAQAPAPAMPSLSPEQSEQVKEAIGAERATVEGRVGRGELTPDEAERLLAWREWQIAQQVSGQAPPPVVAAPGGAEQAPPYNRYSYAYPAPYSYGPPAYYWGPRYYWGPSVCAGGWGHHGGGRICF